MDWRQIFSSQHFWGKILGAILGFLMAGPAGALFGIIIGNFFDRGLNEHISNAVLAFHREPRARVKSIFFQAIFPIMGCIAKADGVVSEAEIEMANALMRDMKLNSQQKKQARFLFNEGKKTSFDMNPLLRQFNNTCDNQQLIKLFINILYDTAQLDGLSEKKIYLMNMILTQLQYAPIHEQARFNEDAYHQSYRQSSSQSPSYGYQQQSLQQAYTTLNIQATNNKQVVKRAYRQLMSQHHPDKLIAKGATSEQIRVANEKTQTIRKAYEKICAEQGW